jgi:hypothetical protein
MTKIDLASHILALLRREKHAPLTRYSVVMAVAAAGTDGATVREVAKRLGDDYSTMGGSFQKIAEGGWVRCLDPTQRPQRWVPSEKGLAAVQKFLLSAVAK